MYYPHLNTLIKGSSANCCSDLAAVCLILSVYQQQCDITIVAMVNNLITLHYHQGDVVKHVQPKVEKTLQA